MDSGFNLGRLFGIQFRIHFTWFAIFALVVASLSWQVFPADYPFRPWWLYWAMGIITSVLFFGSVLAHELTHSLVAKAHGIPVKSITLFIFGGVAQITKEAARPGAEFRIAIVGPACSLVIGALFGLLWLATQHGPAAVMAFRLAYINVTLAVFNLLPGFPLDGGRVLRSILWRTTGNYGRATKIAVLAGRSVGYFFIAAGIAIMFLLGEWLSGLWLAFIGWFLENVASSSYRQTRWQEAFRRFTASQVMTPDGPAVPPDTTISRLVQEHVLAGGHDFFLVGSEGRLMGALTLRNIKSVPQRDWDATRVKDILTPIDKLAVARYDQDLVSILEQMSADDLDYMPVVSEGRVIGVIARHNLMRFIRTRSELGL
ncbi:MAG: site-2 protease family protein [Chloroflexi bacterium]|nr:site-2 protease family protein [Chloroflexota bacterium]